MIGQGALSKKQKVEHNMTELNPLFVLMKQHLLQYRVAEQRHIIHLKEFSSVITRTRGFEKTSIKVKSINNGIIV